MAAADIVDFETFFPEMTKEDIFEWFRKRLNRQPEAYDIYRVAKEFYQLGSYARAKSCLIQYLALPGSSIPGRHLLGYCHLNLNENEKALREFKKCVKGDANLSAYLTHVEGYDDDWQLVIELLIDLDSTKKNAHNFHDE